MTRTPYKASPEQLALRMLDVYASGQRLSYAQINSRLRLISVSPNLQQMLGLPAAPQPGQPAAEAIDLLLGVEPAMREILRGKREHFLIERIRVPADQWPERYLDLRLLRMNPAEAKEGLLLLVEDVSHSGDLEQRLTQQRNELALLRDELALRAAMLEERNQALDAFGHAVAHDLRNPLASILATTDLVEMYVQSDPPRSLPHVETLRLSAMRMEDIIASLLMLTTLRQEELVLSPVSAALIAEDVTAHLALRLRAAHVDLKVAQPLPTVLAQKTLLAGVFTNLIENAVKYIGSRNAEPRIWVRARVDGALARFEIEDNGLGISAEAQQRLFRMFQRAHIGEAPGFGVGLSVVSQVIHRLGGEVGVISAEGQGSTFWFTLPLAEAEQRLSYPPET